jgi:hypothetical protein
MRAVRVGETAQIEFVTAGRSSLPENKAEFRSSVVVL